MNRRAFIKTTTSSGLGWLATRGSLPAAEATSQGGAILLGGPVYIDTQDPDALASAHRNLGYGAAYCPPLPLEDTSAIRAHAVAFKQHRVTIAEVGRWVNLMETDAEQRQVNLKEVIDGLALAEEIGALCCVDIAGSLNRDVWYGPHPENLSRGFFDAAVENARKIVDAVRPRRAKFCYEMMGWALPDSPESYAEMIRAVDRKQFGAHLDPCNLVNSPKRFYGSTALLEDCFRQLGPHIVSCHAKDLRWEVEMNVHFREVIPGTGSLDYRAYLRLLERLPQRPPLMLEHLKGKEEYDQARRHLLELGKREGIRFG